MKKLTLILFSALMCALTTVYLQHQHIRKLKEDIEVGEIHRERDSLQYLLNASEERLLYMEMEDMADSIRIAELERDLKERERKHQKNRTKYGTDIQKVNHYTPTMVDSFLIDMYPRPGVRKYRYNPDGTRRYDSDAHSYLEDENDDSAGDPIRLRDERIRKVVSGQ